MRRMPLPILLLTSFGAGVWLAPSFQISARPAECSELESRAVAVRALGTISDAGLTLTLLQDERLETLREHQASRLVSAIDLASQYAESLDGLDLPIPNLIEGLRKAEGILGRRADAESTLAKLRALRARVEVESEAAVARDLRMD